MKVAFVITGLSTGGAEIMLHKLLQNIDRTRFEPIVVSLTSKGEIGERIEALGVPVDVLGMRPGLPNPFALFRLARLLRRAKPDVVHTWMYHADLLGGLAARLAGCHRVIWGIRHGNLSKSENKRGTLMVIKLCARLSGRLPARILSCSQRAKEVHAAIGYIEERIHVIPNGFDLSHFAPDAAAHCSLLAELSLTPDTLLVGVVARFDPQKNHLGFVQAAAQLMALVPQVHFVLAGTEVNGDNVSLQAAIAEHEGLQARMHLLGRRDDVPRLMAAFDVLASPSHGEAFPNVLGEAMASGLPCVVTDAGDSAEIIGATGHVVGVGDMAALAQRLQEVLLLPKAQRAALGHQARTRIRAEYEIRQVVARYQAFYQLVAMDNN
ncbi:glycosyltransferase family 4 protein [Variovorax guangxiensis]|uniref:Glycosyltransferase n=1 Tax=Variovorax guangxiensis TaxID=1775474 RepID=A0A502DM80_9BURK|nr:glycosyltransferase [Variovorax guangxiensis]TPG20633.1 glycosyltransferase [Variovorax ginsengisoli]TPG25780.1 glycosyltransferase [Variovorax guangxiensis]